MIQFDAVRQIHELPGAMSWPYANRLMISHFLLWMTTTGLFIAWLQQHSPSAAGIDGLAPEQAEFRLETNLRSVQLAFAPVNGIAFAAGLLALWRLGTGKGGFPTQPGHWLLIAFAGFMAMAALGVYLEPHFSSDAARLLGSIGMTFLLGVIAFLSRDRLGWSISFAALATGSAILSLACLARLSSPTMIPLRLMGLGITTIVAFPLLVLVCAITDWINRRQYDVFHWIGMGTLLGVVGHAAVRWTLMFSG